MNIANRLVVVLAAASLLALPDAAWAGGRGGNRGGSHGAHGSHGTHGTHSGHRHRHGHRGVFIGGARLYPWPYSSYFYPIWADLQEPWPIAFVEQFTGTPTPDTKDWIYCPGKAASYPEVTECPGGWQRVFPQERAAHQAPTP